MTAPIAHAGTEQSYSHPYTLPQTVTLDGSGSYDPDGGTITNYQWYWIDKPPSSTATLSSSTVVNPTFQADVEGSYRLFLVVTDSSSEQSETDPIFATETAFVDIMFKTQEKDLVKPASGQRNVGDYMNEWVDAIEDNASNSPTHASNTVEGITYLSDNPTVAAHPEALGTNNVDWLDIKNVRTTTAKDSGFENRTDSSLSFTDGTLTFAIAPAVANFSFWALGTKYTKSSTESIVITDTEGLWYFYYNGSTLSANQTGWTLSSGHVPIAIVYWDATNKTGITLEDARYFLSMDWATKRNMRTEYVPIRISDSLAYGYSWTQTGNFDSDALIQLFDGKFINIDTEITITDGSPQQLVPLKAPLYYYTASGIRKLTATNFPMAYGYGSGRCAYNNAGVLTEMTDKYYSCTILAITDDINNPIIGIVGSSEYASYDDVLLSLGLYYQFYIANTPYLNYRPYGAIIFQTDSAFTNTPKAACMKFSSYINNQTQTPFYHHCLLGTGNRASHPDTAIAGDYSISSLSDLANALNVHDAIFAVANHAVIHGVPVTGWHYPLSLHGRYYDLNGTTDWTEAYDPTSKIWKISGNLDNTATDAIVIDADIAQQESGSGKSITGLTISYSIGSSDIFKELSLMCYIAKPDGTLQYLDFGGSGGQWKLTDTQKSAGDHFLVRGFATTPITLDRCDVISIEILADNKGGSTKTTLVIYGLSIDFTEVY